MTDNPSESETSPGAPGEKKAAEPRAAAETGIATRYWLELIPYPAGSARSLWLFVNNDWRHLDNPELGTQISVQDAFCKCPKSLEVAVWYIGDTIVGLLVKTK